MLSFVNDYSEGAHEQVLRRLAETNRGSNPDMGPIHTAPGQGEDPAGLRLPGGRLFLVGGTQTNQAVISALLAPWEGGSPPPQGHICTHEAEPSRQPGTRCWSCPSRGEAVSGGAADLSGGLYGDENHEHMVFPGMVYLSWPTELGTLYTRAELGEIHKVCRQYKIPLYLDGARMGYGLASRGSGMTLADLAASCDVFYIGGTKVGALFGEAVVFPRTTPPGAL